MLNGAKTFITNGINADLVVVAARTTEDKHGGLSLFVVERGMEGFERGKQIEKLGQHASDTVGAVLRQLPRAGGEPARRRRARGSCSSSAGSCPSG